MAIKRKKEDEPKPKQRAEGESAAAGSTSEGGPQKRELTRPELERLRERLQKKFH